MTFPALAAAKTHSGPSVVVSVVMYLGILAKQRLRNCRMVSCLLTDANGRATRSWFVVPVAEGSNPSTHPNETNAYNGRVDFSLQAL